MSSSPAAFPDPQIIISKASASDFSHALGPKLGVGNELRLETNPAPTRPLAIGGGRKSRKHRKSRKPRKSRKHRKSRKSRKHRNKSSLMKKYRKHCKKSVVASCNRRFRKNNKVYMNGGNNGGNIIDSAVYGIDQNIDTVAGALANPTPVSRMNACVV